MDNDPQQEPAGIWTSGWRMFTTTAEEISDMLDGHKGTVTIEPDGIIFKDYPFAPAIACRQENIEAACISDIDINAHPLTIRVGHELLFVSVKDKDRLLLFANANHIPLVKRDDIWGWILEPFLDTEYTGDTHQRLNRQLATYGLSEEQVYTIRMEVKIQMLKYNFDTALWEWVSLGLKDVLCAMRAKYDATAFAAFYQKAMDIALLPGHPEQPVT